MGPNGKYKNRTCVRGFQGPGANHYTNSPIARERFELPIFWFKAKYVSPTPTGLCRMGILPPISHSCSPSKHHEFLLDPAICQIISSFALIPSMGFEPFLHACKAHVQPFTPRPQIYSLI